MMFSRHFRRSAALAAAAAIALQALWPLIAQARPNDSISVPVCSADGVRHDIELPLGKTKDGSEHCKLCVLGADKDSVVAAPVSFDFSSGSEIQNPVDKEFSRQYSFPLPAHPRAPPQVS